MRKLIKIAIIPALFLGLGWLFLAKTGWNGKDDLRLAVIADDRAGIVTVSPNRRMINAASTRKETKLWIPGGWGWYEADKLKKISLQAKEPDLALKTMFYNFGFVPKYLVTVEKFDDWNNDFLILRSLGWVDLIKYKFHSRGMIVNSEEIGSIDDPQADEILLRDFSDNNLLTKETRLTVVNATEESGFAQFIGEKLGWMGMSVVGVENSDEPIEGCLVAVKTEADFEMEEVGIMKNLWNCEIKAEAGIAEGEIYLSLGDKLASMLKYSSYK